MTAPSSIDPAHFLHEQLAQASPDLLRDLLTTFVNALLSAQADAVCGAGYGERSEERVNSRNGYRHRDLDTRVGTLDVAVPAGWSDGTGFLESLRATPVGFRGEAGRADASARYRAPALGLSDDPRAARGGGLAGQQKAYRTFVSARRTQSASAEGQVLRSKARRDDF